MTAIPLDELSDHLLASVARFLDTSDLARMRAVSQAWKALTEKPEVLRASFKGTWGVGQVRGDPRKQNFFLAAGLGHFVVKVQLGLKTSLAALAVKYQTDSVSLRVLNNCTSDFSLQCRAYVYVPVPRRDLLRGQSVVFAYDAACGRQLVVADGLTDRLGGDATPRTPEDLLVSTFDALARGAAPALGGPQPACLADDGAGLDGHQREALLKKLSKHMGRGLNIDEHTASYYLKLAHGDMKQAITMYREDLEWEVEHPTGVLPLREPA